MRHVHPRSHLQLRVLVHVEKFAALLSCVGDNGSVLLEYLESSILVDKDVCECSNRSRMFARTNNAEAGTGSCFRTSLVLRGIRGPGTLRLSLKGGCEPNIGTPHNQE